MKRKRPITEKIVPLPKPPEPEPQVVVTIAGQRFRITANVTIEEVTDKSAEVIELSRHSET